MKFQFVRAPAMKRLLSKQDGLADWAEFAASWNRLRLDRYMADGGRYRRRRHAVFSVSAGRVRRLAHRPHYQGLDYNPLNGGVKRWFEPIEPAIGRGKTLRSILAFAARRFGAGPWRVEVHQFRIEARAGRAGRPTPEGAHRDGVDHVLALLVERRNVRRGRTTIADVAGRSLGAFTLREPLDAALLDDRKVYHGVTPIEPLDRSKPGYRDVLVVTFRRRS